MSSTNYGFKRVEWQGMVAWLERNFNPYSSRAVDHTGVARFGAYDGNFHAHVPEAPVAPRATDQRNIYSGGNGSVYRHNPSGTWERNTGQSWQRAQSPTSRLEQHALGRNMGEQRSTTSVHMAVGISRPAGGSGHVGGGGTGDLAQLKRMDQHEYKQFKPMANLLHSCSSYGRHFVVRLCI